MASQQVAEDLVDNAKHLGIRLTAVEEVRLVRLPS
mgnify:CR=1 FL=1